MRACTFQITVFKQLYMYFGNKRQVMLNRNEIMRVFHDAWKRVLRVLYNAIYRRYSRKLCKNTSPNTGWTLLYNTRNAESLSVNAYDAFSWCSYGLAATDSNCFVLSLRQKDTLHGLFEKLCSTLRAKEKSFHRRILVVTKLRELLSIENILAVKKWNDTENIGQKYY